MPTQTSGKRKPLIALLEDDSLFSEAMACILKTQGYDVIAFQDKRDFLHHVNHDPDRIPDLVISDIFSPGINGMEFLKAWKEDKRFNHVPVLIVSGNSHNHSEALKALGAYACLSKSWDDDSFLAVVRGALVSA